MDDKFGENVVDFFNLVLGTGPQSAEYWDKVLRREVMARFNYEIDFSSVPPRPALFLSMQREVCLLSHTRARAHAHSLTHSLTVSSFNPHRME